MLYETTIGDALFQQYYQKFTNLSGCEWEWGVQYCDRAMICATIVTLLVDAGYDDATIMLRTGHGDVKSLRMYHNLSRKIELNQLKRMFEIREILWEITLSKRTEY